MLFHRKGITAELLKDKGVGEFILLLIHQIIKGMVEYYIK
jgi:hypothetical protein